MIIDSSALVAIFFKEPEAAQFAALLNQTSNVYLSTCALVETSMVLESQKSITGVRELNLLLHRNIIETVPFDNYQATLARYAFTTYGKSRHRAKLNMGDCFTYALAKAKNMPLLFKGNDFIHTDITPAIAA